MRIGFFGAAESVTGSCHLVEADTGGGAGVRFLLDCGQFQGSARQLSQNFEPFPFEPGSVDFLILSHAHIDHCGRLPVLVREGFRGRIYCTDATADLLPIMLRDSAHIHEKEAEWKNRKGQRAGKEPVEPLYTLADAEAALAYITPVLYDQEASPAEGVRFSFSDAGHILGSAITEVFLREGEGETKLVYSGDLGVESRPLLRDPVKIRKADVLVMETTYGARLHDKVGPAIGQLAEAIERTVKRGGTVLIPSFAVGRTQELIYELNRYYGRGGADKGEMFRNLKVYIDSPMATAATEVFRKNIQDFDEDYKALVMSGVDPLDFANLVFTRGTDESKALNADDTPKIIISASGMCDAGRIRHHLKHRLWDRRSTVVFVGYQAEGTLGRRLIDGAQSVSLFGEEIDVNAEIVSIEGLSAHADRDGLLEWVRGFDVPPKALFLVHGEGEAKRAFAKTLLDECGIGAVVVDGFCEHEVAAGILGRDVRVGTGGLDSGSAPGMTDTEGAGGRVAAIDEEERERLLAKLRGIGDNMEGLLYRARLAVYASGDEGAGDYAALKNIIVSLEHDASKLAGELAGQGAQREGGV